MIEESRGPGPKVEFFKDLFKKNDIKSVLDIGYMTGNHIKFFTGYAEKVTAVNLLKGPARHPGADKVEASGITTLKVKLEGLDRISEGPFDLVTCLGDTLPMLGKRKNVKLALKKIRNKLTASGLAIVRLLNFNSDIMEKNRYYNPKTFKKDGRSYVLIRHSEYGKIKTRFDFIVTVISNDEIIDFFVDSLHMCTLKVNMFLKIAENSGFKRISLKGPDGKEAFNRKKHTFLYALMRR